MTMKAPRFIAIVIGRMGAAECDRKMWTHDHSWLVAIAPLSVSAGAALLNLIPSDPHPNFQGPFATHLLAVPSVRDTS